MPRFLNGPAHTDRSRSFMIPGTKNEALLHLPNGGEPIGCSASENGPSATTAAAGSPTT